MKEYKVHSLGSTVGLAEICARQPMLAATARLALPPGFLQEHFDGCLHRIRGATDGLPHLVHQICLIMENSAPPRGVS